MKILYFYIFICVTFISCSGKLYGVSRNLVVISNLLANQSQLSLHIKYFQCLLFILGLTVALTSSKSHILHSKW